MADHSSIEWTDASWNPVRGCALVSPGCTNCYAMRQAHRFSAPGKPYAGLTKMTKGGPVWTGGVNLMPDLLGAPLKWKQPRRIFVNSMSDLFHEDVPHDFIARVFATMLEARQHIFQILTKRPARMLATIRRFVEENEQYGGELPENVPPRNVWLGVSVEDQARADERIPLLLKTPAAVRWISAEPLLGAVDLGIHRRADGGVATFLPVHERGRGGEIRHGGIDWLVVGGESGHGARPFDIAWARSLLHQCRSAGVPFFLKQLGRYPFSNRDEGYPWAQLYDNSGVGVQEWGLFDGPFSKGNVPAEWPEDLRVREYPS